MSENKTLFIATVGIGTNQEDDITKPLIKSISEANPSYLLLFATNHSKDNAQKILNELKRTSDNSCVHIISNKDHLQDIFKEMNDKITELLKQGYDRKSTIVDFTTGTKPMSAALCLVAIKHNCGHLRYISVKRGKDRKVINGSETSFTFEPVGIFTSFAIDTAINFIKKYRFDSALELLEGINKGLLTDEEKALVENLRYLIRAYNYWDKFDHIKFSTNYDKVKFNHPDLQQFKIKDKTKAHVNTIGEKLKDKQISDLAIADLVNNAKRRYEEGKYDDAVARLYRTVEMLAQWRLKTEYNQDSANITLDDLPQKTREWIIKSCKDGKIQIGLQACYQLLADLEHPLGKEFESDEKLKGLLRTRNDSILAHGIKPIEKSTCEELIQVIINYCKKYIPDFNKLLCELEFPWQCKQNPSQPY